MSESMPLDLGALLDAYRSGATTPRAVVAEQLQRIEACRDANLWIHVCTSAELEPYLARLDDLDAASLPLFGVPFAVKDNIDVAGLPTTAACEAYRYLPGEHAFVVARLIDAGAIPLGKTNLDQFATGLVGTRSPWGVVPNAFDARYITGGSSSGSAGALSRGLVSFALGTDTAGSGRIPAAFGNLLGVKPTRGLLSNRGVVPACRSLDCVSIFALCPRDAALLLDVCAEYDPWDPSARRADPDTLGGSGMAHRTAAPLRIGVPDPAALEYFGAPANGDLFAAAVARLRQAGAELVTVDIEPLRAAGRLLYGGPWVAERSLVVRELLAEHPEALLPVTRSIMVSGDALSAADAFAAGYRLTELRRAALLALADLDCLVLPTAPRCYPLAAIEADPLTLNNALGHYCNAVNLLDLCALACPAGFDAQGIPFGVTLLAAPFRDRRLLEIAVRYLARQAWGMGATGLPLVDAPLAPSARAPECIEIAVCGAHLSGMPLNGQLTSRGARLTLTTRSAPGYRLYDLGGTPPRPALVRSASGQAIELEVWAVPAAQVGSFLAGIPTPLGLGKVLLESGEQVVGFIAEEGAVAGAKDVTDFGGWRSYRATG